MPANSPNPGNTRRRRRWCSILLAAALTSLGCDARSEDATTPSTRPANIALGRPYTWNTQPDYPYCTTGTESAKLTDGIYTAGGRFWTQPTTVGWQQETPIILTLDLGAIEPISGLSFSTAAGAGNARWPAGIDVLVSDDGKQYTCLGDLVELDAMRAGRAAPADTAYATHRFWCDSLSARGRYIAFAVTPFNYTFIDEIEVYRGNGDLPPAPAPTQTYADPAAFLQQTAVPRGIARRLHRDAMTIGAPPPAAAPQPATAPDFRAVLPLSPEHRDLYRAAAAQLRAAGMLTPFAQASSPWDPLPHIGPPAQAAAASIDTVMMQNEYRAGALTLTNPLDEDIEVEMHFEGLPGGAAPTYTSIAEVQFTDTRPGEVVAAALPEARRSPGGWTIHVPPGMTRQVWITFHPVDVPSGTYSGKVLLRGEKSLALEVPVNLRIAPVRFPDRPSLSLGGWDYADLESGNALTPANRSAVINHLREHFVDSPWATKQVLPAGKHDPVLGTMSAPPDTRRFDAWVRSWPAARRYCVFLAGTDTFQGFHVDRPQFAAAVGQWIRFWADHARQLGIDPANLYLLPVDEPSKAQQDRVAIAWAKALRASGAGVTIWEDPIHVDPAKADPQLFALSHILCPNRQILSYNADYRQFFTQLRPGAGRMELYSASGPARSLDPYAYYRLQAWECWKWGARAQYFWSFCDDGGASSWNEYAAPHAAYTPLFVDASSVTGSKQMEAIREGIEDYEYLAMLGRRLDELEAQGQVTLKALEARDLLENAAARVLPEPGAVDIFWRDTRDRSLADKVRLEVLETLISLQ